MDRDCALAARDLADCWGRLVAVLLATVAVFNLVSSDPGGLAVPDAVFEEHEEIELATDLASSRSEKTLPFSSKTNWVVVGGISTMLHCRVDVS